MSGAIKRVTVEVEMSEDTAAALAELAARCNNCGAIADGFASHGSSFNASSLLAMLAEDAGKIVSNPDSWQSANMAHVLASHGYMVARRQQK